MTKKSNNGCLLCLTRDDVKGYDFKTINVRTKRVNLKQLQSAVGGYIELCSWFRDLAIQNIDVWVDEDGKAKNLKPTVFCKYNNKLVDYLSGNLIFSKADKFGNSLPLSQTDVKLIKDYFKKLNVIDILDNHTDTHFDCIVVSEKEYA